MQILTFFTEFFCWFLDSKIWRILVCLLLDNRSLSLLLDLIVYYWVRDVRKSSEGSKEAFLWVLALVAAPWGCPDLRRLYIGNCSMGYAYSRSSIDRQAEPWLRQPGLRRGSTNPGAARLLVETCWRRGWWFQICPTYLDETRGRRIFGEWQIRLRAWGGCEQDFKLGRITNRT